MDSDTSAVQSVIALQYNPEALMGTLQIQAMQGGVAFGKMFSFAGTRRGNHQGRS